MLNKINVWKILTCLSTGLPSEADVIALNILTTWVSNIVYPNIQGYPILIFLTISILTTSSFLCRRKELVLLGAVYCRVRRAFKPKSTRGESNTSYCLKTHITFSDSLQFWWTKRLLGTSPNFGVGVGALSLCEIVHLNLTMTFMIKRFDGQCLALTKRDWCLFVGSRRVEGLLGLRKSRTLNQFGVEARANASINYSINAIEFLKVRKYS